MELSVFHHTHTHTHTAKCIDRYTELKVREFDGQLEEIIDPQLEDIVNRMFARCLSDRRYKQAIGVAFETRRLDILERVLNEAVRNCSNLYNTVFIICQFLPSLYMYNWTFVDDTMTTHCQYHTYTYTRE